MRILVTGGAGFIGSNFIRHMLSNYSGCEIVNFDKLTYAGNLENCADYAKDKRYSFVRGDICDWESVKKAAKGMDAVVNFAAESHVDRSIEAPDEFVRTDVLGTQKLLEAARLLDVKKYLQISTDEVYGSINGGSFTEESPLEPNSPYSASKASADLLTRSYEKTHGMFTIITRSSNNYGPCQHPEKFMPRAITNLLLGKKVPVYGSGKNVRDWLHVLDNCAGIGTVLGKGKKGGIYNIGGECEKENLEVAREICRILGKDGKSIEYVADRKGHDFRYSLSCKKLKKLGWKQKIGFDDGLKETVEWYKKNRKWWEPLV